MSGESAPNSAPVTKITWTWTCSCTQVLENPGLVLAVGAVTGVRAAPRACESPVCMHGRGCVQARCGTAGEQVVRCWFRSSSAGQSGERGARRRGGRRPSTLVRDGLGATARACGARAHIRLIYCSFFLFEQQQEEQRQELHRSTASQNNLAATTTATTAITIPLTAIATDAKCVCRLKELHHIYASTTAAV